MNTEASSVGQLELVPLLPPMGGATFIGTAGTTVSIQGERAAVQQGYFQLAGKVGSLVLDAGLCPMSRQTKLRTGSLTEVDEIKLECKFPEGLNHPRGSSSLELNCRIPSFHLIDGSKGHSDLRVLPVEGVDLIERPVRIVIASVDWATLSATVTLGCPGRDRVSGPDDVGIVSDIPRKVLIAADGALEIIFDPNFDPDFASDLELRVQDINQYIQELYTRHGCF